LAQPSLLHHRHVAVQSGKDDLEIFLKKWPSINVNIIADLFADLFSDPDQAFPTTLDFVSGSSL
jgi:hypothetical protein